MAVQTLTQTLQISGQAAFGRTVGVVAGTASVTGHRANGSQGATPLRLQPVGPPRQVAQRCNQIGVQAGLKRGPVVVHGVGLRQHAISQQHRIHGGRIGQRRVQGLLPVGHVVEVVRHVVNLRGAA